MLDTVLKLLLAYLLGNLMGGSLIGRLRGGVDLRSVGSGNIGATNALRTQGPAFALGVLLIDLLKGVVAARLIPQLATIGTPLLSNEALAYGCGVAVALGHCYPLLHGGRGGKGVATLAGVFGALLGPALLWMLAAFALIVILSGYVSLATLGAAFTAIAWTTLAQGPGSAANLFALAMSALIVWTHRHNIRRLLDGSESRFEKARVLHRWRQR